MMEIGTFLIGNDSDFAHSTFSNLQGNKNEEGMLRIDLTESPQHVPTKRLKSITCSLDQYVENCRVITRDVFKFFTLECKNLKSRYSITGIAGQTNAFKPPLISYLPSFTQQ